MQKLDRSQIGASIRYYRIRAGLSQMDLESEAEMSNGSISRIENGEVEPTIETRFRIAEALGLDIKETAYLMGVNFYNKTISKGKPELGTGGKNLLSVHTS